MEWCCLADSPDRVTEPQGKRAGRLGQVFPGGENAMGGIWVHRKRLAAHAVHPLQGQGSGNLHGKVCIEAICAVVKENTGFRDQMNCSKDITLPFVAVWPRAVVLKVWSLVQ